MTDGFGTITWWGFSPALDLQSLDKSLDEQNLAKSMDNSEELNVLLIGSGDIRHVLMTAARTYRHRKRKIHFYILENNLELYARHMLFLAITLEPKKSMGLQEKTELFLELYGNILVRQQSCDYVMRISNEFIKMVTDLSYLEEKLPVVDLSQLKFKERDFLEGIFKFWRNPDNGKFDVCKLWDLRLRQYLRVRYDARLNVYDWDYHMKLAEKGADVIGKREYSKWRNKGVAFEIRDGAYDVPNKTLASGLIVKRAGERFVSRGYWGDILVSPYISLGIETEEKSFYKRYNNLYSKTAQDIAEYNVFSCLYEITNNKKYVLPKTEKTEELQEAKIVEITEEEEEKESIQSSTSPTVDESVDDEVEHQNYEYIPINSWRVTFLPINSLSDLSKKRKYQESFHIVYFANSLVHLLTPDVTPLFANQCHLILETAKFLLDLRDDQTTKFVTRVTELARAAGCQETEPCNAEKAVFAEFVYTREQTP